MVSSPAHFPFNCKESDRYNAYRVSQQLWYPKCIISGVSYLKVSERPQGRFKWLVVSES